MVQWSQSNVILKCRYKLFKDKKQRKTELDVLKNVELFKEGSGRSFCVCGYEPGGQYLRGLELWHHVEEVVAEENSPLCQQDGETDRIPDDASLTLRQLTLIVRFRYGG